MTGAPQPANAAAAGEAIWASELPSFWFLAGVALRNRYLMLALPLVSGTVAGLKVVLSPRQYAASASFVPQEPSSGDVRIGQLASQFGLAPARSSTTSPQFYADLLRSREILRGVVTTTYRLPGSADSLGDLVRHFGVEAPTRLDGIHDAMTRLDERLDVRTDRNTGVVRFEVSTSESALSEQIAKRFLELVNEFNLLQRQSQAQAEREFVEARLAQAQQALTEAEETLTAFYARNRRFEDSPQLRAEEARLQRRVALRQQLYLTLAQSHENAKIQEVRNTPVITVIERPEDFVEPRPRHLVGITLLGLFLGGVFAVAVAVGREFLAKARSSSSEEYQAFAALREQTINDLRRRLFGKAPK